MFPNKANSNQEKNLLSPWITRGIIKSSKRKQKLYIKFLKNKSYANEERCKQYKRLFEKIKNYSKKLLLQLQYHNNAKKTWDTIKAAIGKAKIKINNFPRKLLIKTF